MRERAERASAVSTHGGQRLVWGNRYRHPVQLVVPAECCLHGGLVTKLKDALVLRAKGSELTESYTLARASVPEDTPSRARCRRGYRPR
jgi:hypothetical protein